MKKPEFVYHCTTMRNLLHILKEKEPKLRTLSGNLKNALKKNIDIRNFNTNLYLNEDAIAFSFKKPLWIYGSVCLKIRFSKLDEKFVKFVSMNNWILPRGLDFGKKQEVLYFKDIRIADVEEILFNQIIEYLKTLLWQIFIVAGIISVSFWIFKTIGGIFT